MEQSRKHKRSGSTFSYRVVSTAIRHGSSYFWPAFCVMGEFVRTFLIPWKTALWAGGPRVYCAIVQDILCIPKSTLLDEYILGHLCEQVAQKLHRVMRTLKLSSSGSKIPYSAWHRSICGTSLVHADSTWIESRDSTSFWHEIRMSNAVSGYSGQQTSQGFVHEWHLLLFVYSGHNRYVEIKSPLESYTW